MHKTIEEAYLRMEQHMTAMANLRPDETGNLHVINDSPYLDKETQEYSDQFSEDSALLAEEFVNMIGKIRWLVWGVNQ